MANSVCLHFKHFHHCVEPGKVESALHRAYYPGSPPFRYGGLTKIARAPAPTTITRQTALFNSESWKLSRIRCSLSYRKVTMKKALAILGILISTTTMGMDDNTKREHIAIIQEKYPTNEGVALAYYSLQDKITRILFWHTRGISLHRACIVDGKFNRCASD